MVSLIFKKGDLVTHNQLEGSFGIVVFNSLEGFVDIVWCDTSMTKLFGNIYTPARHYIEYIILVSSILREDLE